MTISKIICPTCSCKRWRGVGWVNAHSDDGTEPVMRIVECMRCGEVFDVLHVDYKQTNEETK